MRNFMSENSGKTSLVLRNRQNSRINHNFSPGQAKGVLCRVLNYCDLPLIPLGTCVNNLHQSGSYSPDNVIRGAGLHDAGMTDNLAKALKSQLLLLRLRQTDVGFAARFRINKLNPTDGDSRKNYREET